MKPVRILIVILLCGMAAAVTCRGQAGHSFEIKTGKTAQMLKTSPAKGEAIVWHLYHSGFALKTAHHFLIFDYWPGQDLPKGKKGLDAGLIDPGRLKGENVVVFISHEHGDHFYPDSLKWKDNIENIHYVVPPGVPAEDKGFAADRDFITVLAPNRSAKVGEVWIKTLLSTDSGVAFLVKADGLTIYHSGDHACWNWNDDPKSEKKFVTKHLKSLEGESIDIGMHVCDARLKGKGWGGIFAFAGAYKPKLLVPMHLSGNYKVLPEVESLLEKNKIQVPFWRVQSPGECIVFRPRR